MGELLPTDRCRAVVLHPGARSLAPAFVEALEAAFGERVLVLPDDERRVWVYDYFPLLLQRRDGGLEQIPFLSDRPGESGFALEDLDAEVRRLPLFLRRGHICAVGPVSVVSEAAVKKNQDWPSREGAARRLRRGGFRPRSRDEIRQLLAETLRHQPDEIVFLPPMPGEATGHLTPYLRVISTDAGRRVLVPELGEEAFSQIGYAHEIGLGRLVQTFLDVQAAELARRGVDVVRLPMLPPIQLDRSERPEGWIGRVHSVAAAPVLEVDGVKRAFLPSYDDEAFPAGYRRLKAEVLERWQRFYDELGYEPVVVDATEVARAGGSLLRLVGPVAAPA